MKFHALLCWWLMLPGLVAGSEAPETFAYALPLEVAPGSGLARVALPAAVYEGVARDELFDLRVFDAAGQPAPFALQPAPPPAATTRAVVLPLFPIYARGDAQVQGARMRLHTRGGELTVELEHDGGRSGGMPARQLRGYLADLGEARPALSALRFDWPALPDTQWVTLSVERSDDLDRWHAVAQDITLARMHAQGQDLVRDSVDMDQTRARYLRITFPAGGTLPALSSVQAHLREGAAPVARQWKEVAGQSSGAGEREYDLGGVFPVDRLQLALAGDNAVLPVEILSRRQQDDPWRSVTQATFYRLVQGTRTVANADVAVHSSRHRFWKVRAVQPGAALPAVALRAGWIAQHLVFVMQGKGPYRLVYGHGGVPQAALPIATVIPGYGTGRAPAIAEARAGVQQVLAGPGARTTPLDIKRGALWAALVAGVALLAWMAWSLGRQLKSAPGQD